MERPSFFSWSARATSVGSIILTSNKSYGDWGSIFGDPIIATAILYRLLHQKPRSVQRGPRPESKSENICPFAVRAEARVLKYQSVWTPPVSSRLANETVAPNLAGFRRPVMLTLWGRHHHHRIPQRSLSFSMAMMPRATIHAIPFGVPAWAGVSKDWEIPSIFAFWFHRRLSSFKGTGGFLYYLPMPAAPTASNVRTNQGKYKQFASRWNKGG